MKIQPICLAALCLTTPASFAAQLEILGAMPGGLYSPSLINQTGDVIAGYSDDPQNGTKVGVWTRSTGLTLLDAGTPDRFAPFGMSADGSLIVGDQLDVGPNFLRRSMLWDLAAGTRTDLGVLPGFDGSNVRHISADGSTVVGNCWNVSSNDSQTYRWTAAGGLQPLAPSVIFRPGRDGTNADGTVVVGHTVPTADSFDYRARIWTAAGGISSIPGLPDVRSYATAVSDDGTRVVGIVEDPAFPSGVFYYQPGLGAFPVNLGGGSANSGGKLMISADGSTVVAQVNGRPVKWSLGDGPRVLEFGGYAGPISVSADGNTVSGYRTSSFGSNDSRGFRWLESGQVFMLDAAEPGSSSSGFAVSRDGSTVCGGGGFSSASDAGVGAAWRASSLIGETYCGPGVPSSVGIPAEMRLSGSNSIARGDLELRASGVPPFAFGFFLVSQPSAFVTSVPGSQGNLCLGGAIGRFVGPGQVQQASLFGDMSLAVDLGALPGPLGTFAATPGESLYFQAWFRDVNPVSTSNFTSGATVSVF